MQFAKYGAKVVVNDLMNPDDCAGDPEARWWCAAGGFAEDGDAVARSRAIDAYGRIDIIINNAGILRDKAFANMDDKQFDQVLDVPRGGIAYHKVTK